MTIDPRKVQRHFDRAAAGYDRYAYVQKNILRMALALDAEHMRDGANILDTGCGTGALARSAEAKKGKWQICQLDLSHAMCREAQGVAPAVQGNMEMLPFANASFDAIWSLSSLQWSATPQRAFAEAQRVLRDKGKYIISTFGPKTLQELKTAFGPSPSVNRFPERLAIENMADEAGLSVVEACESLHIDYFLDIGSLLHSIKVIGASYAEKSTPTRTRADFTAMENAYEKLRTAEGLPVSWDVILMLLQKK